MRSETISVIVPAFNEGIEAVKIIEKLGEFTAHLNPEILIVVDDPNDSTIAAMEKIESKYNFINLLVQDYGKGPANAIRYGIDNSNGHVAVVTMADGCDDHSQIPALVELVNRGVAIASASRYMPGGQQVGGPRLKNLFSRLAGISLWLFGNVGTRDATNSYKAYSRSFLNSISIESRAGFEIGIELVAKARRNRLPVAELPTTWIDRSFGQSNFKLFRWIPKYLRWYFYAFGTKSKNNLNRKI